MTVEQTAAPLVPSAAVVVVPAAVVQVVSVVEAVSEPWAAVVPAAYSALGVAVVE